MASMSGSTKNRCAHAGLFEALHYGAEKFGVCHGIPAAEEVRASGASGTRVTCVGRVLSTRSIKSPDG